MKRQAMDRLVAWKNDSGRRPLLLRGARQVGKTWLMKEFGSQEYERTAYVRFDHASPLRDVFASETNVANLLQAVQLHVGFKVEPGKTLLVFDEIQECPGALASLKFFCEEASGIDIIAAGSQLGLSDHVGTGFPVGKVDTQYLYPLSFREFLTATGKGQFAELIGNRDWRMMSPFHDELVRLLKLYFLVGGMPRVVDDYASHNDFARMRRIQNSLLLDYRSDFGKHAPPVQVRRIEAVWDSIPGQLSRENKKFVFGDVQQGTRARDLEFSMLWLTEAGLMRQECRVAKPDLPLEAYRDGAFKGFILDVGLLAAKARLQPRTVLDGSRIFEEFKGALTEQFVQQEIVAELGEEPHYWASPRGDAEVDFLLQGSGDVIPVEAKASVNLQSKSLKFYCGKFRPPAAVRTSLARYFRRTLDYDSQKANSPAQYELIDIPLYAIGQLANELTPERDNDGHWDGGDGSPRKEGVE